MSSARVHTFLGFAHPSQINLNNNLLFNNERVVRRGEKVTVGHVAVTVSKPAAAAAVPCTSAAAPDVTAPQLDLRVRTVHLSSTRWPATEPVEFCISEAVAGHPYDNRTSGGRGAAARRSPFRPIAYNRTATAFPALRGQPRPTADRWPQVWWPSASNTGRTRGTRTVGP